MLHQSINLMPEGAEDVSFATTKVCVHLARQKCVFGDVCLSGVIVEREKKQPYDADCDAKKGEVRRELEHARIAPQRKDRC